VGLFPAKIVKAALLGGLAALAAATAILAYSAYSYDRALASDAPNGIDEEGYVRVGGINQWIQIRGRDRGNPVLLWLNGGPGFSTLGATILYPKWERDFTIVMWDQRGEGKTFERTGPDIASTMSVARMTQDGIELAEYLRARLGKKKIGLLGHSWGSILGVHMVAGRPDLFYAYIGTGQVVQVARGMDEAYPALLARARRQHNDAAASALAKVGPPPYASLADYFVPLRWANELDPPRKSKAPLATLPWRLFRSVILTRYVAAGVEYSQRVMSKPLLEEDIAHVTSFAVPVILVQGSEDLVTPTALANRYFDMITAPDKQFVVLPGDGHLAIFSDTDAFLRVLDERVRPWAR